MIAHRHLLRCFSLWTTGAVIATTVGLSAVAENNDYPTTARVDYVLGCMAANGQTYLVMQKCACSIDVIASMIPYEEYERAETILRMREGQGELGVLFRASRDLEARVQELRQAQVQADLRCF
jgi:hypothetical protein